MMFGKHQDTGSREILLLSSLKRLTSEPKSVHDTRGLTRGQKMRFWCCQDEDRKKKLKPSIKEGVIHRDTLGMHRYKCESKLTITCTSGSNWSSDTKQVVVRLEHQKPHVHYYDVSMPAEATQIIRDHLEWLTPSNLVQKIQPLYPKITASQIHSAWSVMSEILWKRNHLQLLSATTLLDEYATEVDFFDVPKEDGIEQLCWGLKKIAGRLQGKVVEIAMDATCTCVSFLSASK